MLQELRQEAEDARREKAEIVLQLDEVVRTGPAVDCSIHHAPHGAPTINLSRSCYYVRHAHALFMTGMLRR